MKNFVIKTSVGENIGEGRTIIEAVSNALNSCVPDDFIEWACYAEERCEGIECFSMFELYDMAVAVAG